MANEKRLIDANELYAKIGKMAREPRYQHDGEDYYVGIADASGAVYEAPTVDAVEVVHGRWIYHECVSSHDGAISGYSCSECNSFVNEEIFDMDEFHKDFCGHCGAKMDGDENVWLDFGG